MVEDVLVSERAVLLHGGVGVGVAVVRRAAGGIIHGAAVAGGDGFACGLVAPGARQKIERRGRDHHECKAGCQHARPRAAAALFGALLFVQPLEHTLGKAIRRVKLRQVFEHRVQDHELRQALAAGLTLLQMRQKVAAFGFIQFSVCKGRERGGIVFTALHLALIPSRLHSVTFDADFSKKFPLTDKKLRKSVRPRLMRDFTVPSSSSSVSEISE